MIITTFHCDDFKNIDRLPLKTASAGYQRSVASCLERGVDQRKILYVDLDVTKKADINCQSFVASRSSMT